MSEPQVDTEHAFTHALTVFSVSSGMIGVCLTAIGLVKIVSLTKRAETLCDDLIALNAVLFGISTFLGFRGLQRFIRHERPLSFCLMDGIFLVGLGLTIVICGLFAWSLL
jgi:hypothetical protein